MKKLLVCAFAATAAATGFVAVSSVSASAEIACAGPVCWHTSERYEYPGDANVVIHPNDWRWKEGEHYSFREHEGRGYWKGDRWMER